MYAVVELQTNNGQMSHLVQAVSTLDVAMSKYHQVLASAAISEVEYHSCVVLDEKGCLIAQEGYEHSVTIQEENAE